MALVGIVQDVLIERICLENQSQKTTIQIENITEIESYEELIKLIKLKENNPSEEESAINILSQESSFEQDSREIKLDESKLKEKAVVQPTIDTLF